MREIKFRAWSEISKEMYLVDELTSTGGLLLLDKQGNPWRTTSGNVIVMQYTGLKDKNGKEIYEGDMVKEGKNIWEIYWDEDNAWFWWRKEEENPLGIWNCSDDPAYPYWNNCMVIGNVYESPELIKHD